MFGVAHAATTDITARRARGILPRARREPRERGFINSSQTG